MKKTVYDFHGAVEYINQWVSPKELSDNLKDAALRCATPDEGMRENMILKMAQAEITVHGFSGKC